jgi:hypothetical protein
LARETRYLALLKQGCPAVGSAQQLLKEFHSLVTDRAVGCRFDSCPTSPRIMNLWGLLPY